MTEVYGDVFVEYGDGWVCLSERGNSDVCLTHEVLRKIVSSVTQNKHGERVEARQKERVGN